MLNIRTVISSLRKDLTELDKKLEASTHLESFGNDQIDQVSEYLDDAIRQLDHAIEHLESCKK